MVWHSPLHRVIKTENPSSIVLFAGPHANTKLLPLPSPLIHHVNIEDAIIKAGQHVQDKLQELLKKI